MSKGLIAFVFVAVVGIAASIIISMKKSAGDARNRSEKVMNDFNAVDKSLQESKAYIDSLNKSLIDSLRTNYNY